MTRPSSELAHLFRALKAPAAARALPKLADRARNQDWSFEQFAAALLGICEPGDEYTCGGDCGLQCDFPPCPIQPL